MRVDTRFEAAEDEVLEHRKWWELLLEHRKWWELFRHNMILGTPEFLDPHDVAEWIDNEYRMTWEEYRATAEQEGE
jgi:hypothetical protein